MCQHCSEHFIKCRDEETEAQRFKIFLPKSLDSKLSKLIPELRVQVCEEVCWTMRLERFIEGQSVKD